MNDKVAVKNNRMCWSYIILHYNQTKGAVGTLDKLAKEYTAQRKSNRCPMVMFSHLIDNEGINPSNCSC